MISKELLSIVLGLTVVKVLELDGTILWYKGIVNMNNQPYAKELSINIYELAHKCKEWAFEFRFDNKPTNNRYYMQRSGYEDKFNVEKQKREKLGYMTLTFGCFGHTKTFYADTEPEAIFKASEWILEQVEKK